MYSTWICARRDSLFTFEIEDTSNVRKALFLFAFKDFVLHYTYNPQSPAPEADTLSIRPHAQCIPRQCCVAVSKLLDVDKFTYII